MGEQFTSLISCVLLERELITPGVRKRLENATPPPDSFSQSPGGMYVKRIVTVSIGSKKFSHVATVTPNVKEGGYQAEVGAHAAYGHTIEEACDNVRAVILSH